MCAFVVTPAGSELDSPETNLGVGEQLAELVEPSTIQQIGVGVDQILNGKKKGRGIHCDGAAL